MEVRKADNLPNHRRHSQVHIQMVYTCKILQAMLFSETYTQYEKKFFPKERKNQSITMTDDIPTTKKDTEDIIQFSNTSLSKLSTI